MVNAFDINAQNLEQRSRNSMMRPEIRTPSHTMGEKMTDLMLSVTFNAAQTFGKYNTQYLAKDAQQIAKRASSGQAFQTQFDSEIKPHLMMNMLLDPAGSIDMIHSSKYIAQDIDYNAQLKAEAEQGRLNKLAERLALSQATSLMSNSNNIDEFTEGANAITGELATQQNLSQEFDMQMGSLMKKATPYFARKSERASAVTNQVVDQYVRNTLNDLAVDPNLTIDAVSGSIDAFKSEVLPLIPEKNRTNALRKMVGDVIGSMSAPKIANEVLNDNKELFKPQEFDRLQQKILANTQVAKRLSAADRKNINSIAQSSLDTGQIWDYETNLSPELSHYNEYLWENKVEINDAYGLGPSAYARWASKVEDPAIKSSLMKTASTLGKMYADDFPSAVENEDFIPQMDKDITRQIEYGLPLIDPESGSIINADPMITSLSIATNNFSDLKSKYFPGDPAVNEMLPKEARSMYQKVYKSLDSENKWGFLMAGMSGVASSQANIQGIWGHRQLSRIAGDRTTTNFTILANDFGTDTGKDAWSTYQNMKQATGEEGRNYREKMTKIKQNLASQFAGTKVLDSFDTEELAAVLALKPDGHTSANINDDSKYLYIKSSFWGSKKLNNLILPGKASGINNASTQLTQSLKSFKHPSLGGLSGWDILDREFSLTEGGPMYRGVINNVRGTYKKYVLQVQNIETGQISNISDVVQNPKNGQKQRVNRGIFTLK